MTPEALRRLTLALNQQHVVSLNIAGCVVEMAKFLPEKEGASAFLERTKFNTSLLELLQKIKENADCITALQEAIDDEQSNAT